MMMRKTSVDVGRVAPQFDSSLEGISHQSAQRLLKSIGRNELPEAHTRGIGKILLSVIKEPMLILLLSCGGIYYALGEPQEAWVLLGFVSVVILITLFQEVKSERALEALRELSSPKAWVFRDGQKVHIDSRDVVPGDLMWISEGDRVCADGILVQGSHLSVDESLLTGESAPVQKIEWRPGSMPEHSGGQNPAEIYSGTLVVSGHGLVRVTATGQATAIGKIGSSLNTIEETSTALQIETRWWVGRLALLGAGMCLTVTLGFGLMHEDWLGGILSGLTLAMAVLPEEFPVVLTIFMAMGAFRLSRVNVLTRRNQTIESLGSATVICTDKTGTLTENRMQLQSLCIQGHFVDCGQRDQRIPESHHILIETALLASQREPFDPMERELFAVGRAHAAEHIHESWRLEKQYPLTRELLAMSCVWTGGGDQNGFIVATKGAPEAVMDLCHLTHGEAAIVRRDINQMAGKGLRVLGVARTRAEALPDIQHDFAFEFVGLIGFMDPIRQQVPSAIKLCRSAGIRIVMITGDYPITAQQIGSQIGLDQGRIVTGEDLFRMTEKSLLAALPSTSIFARVVPEQKLKIIQSFQAKGDIVAMTGDGVNDAPALKAANIGIAMGLRGTDVAREAADIVLLNDAFDSIVEGVRIGRRIFNNLQKAVAYIIAVHLPIAGITLLPLLLESAIHRLWPTVLMPIHVVFLEMIIDPACTIVFEVEPAEKDIMDRAPRAPGARLMNKRLLILSLVQGIVASLTSAAVYGYAVISDMVEEEIRSVTFASLVFGNLALLWVNRSWSESFIESLRIKNSALWWVMGGTLITLGLSLYLPWAQSLFHFVAPSHHGILLALAGGPISVTWFEIYKAIVRYRIRHSKSHMETSLPSKKRPKTEIRKPRRKRHRRR